MFPQSKKRLTYLHDTVYKPFLSHTKFIKFPISPVPQTSTSYMPPPQVGQMDSHQELWLIHSKQT